MRSLFYYTLISFRSVQFSRSGVSNSLWPHWLQHGSLLCPLPSPRVCSNSCPLSQWCHPTISSSVIPFSSCLQSLAASGSFQISQFFGSGDQSIGVSASASVFPMNIQDWFPLGWTGWISGIGKMSFLYCVKDAVITGILSHRFTAPLVPLNSNIQCRINGAHFQRAWITSISTQSTFHKIYRSLPVGSTHSNFGTCPLFLDLVIYLLSVLLILRKSHFPFCRQTDLPADALLLQ